MSRLRCSTATPRSFPCSAASFPTSRSRPSAWCTLSPDRRLLLHRLGSPRGRGQILPIFALMFFFLFAIVALALDAGHLFLANLQVQNAVDSAALAAGKTLALQ